MEASSQLQSPNASDTRRDTATSTFGSFSILPWLLVLFVGSGCAALIYEIVWLQLLQLVIGLTTGSLGFLLGSFMGGMCLGSLLLPRLISPQRHPLRVYAALEFLIGVLGIAILFLVPKISQIYGAAAGPGLKGMLWRGAVAAICLLPPTILMGGTLPAVARWITLTRQGASWLGFFYGGNIAGGVLGCLLAGFYLLRVHDSVVATGVAAGINFAVAVVALGLSARTRCPISPETTSPENSATPRSNWAIYLAIGLSGMSALGAEVVWTRLLALTFGGTVYTFSIILAVFLIGLGLGSSAGSVLTRRVDSARLALGACQALLAVGIAWTALMICRSLPYWPVNPAISLSPWYTFQLDFVRCLWAVLPAACLWGASFPLAIAAVADPQQDAGRLVGGVYAANTVGAIFGALVFSLILIPLAGTQGAQRVLLILTGGATAAAMVPMLFDRKALSGCAGGGLPVSTRGIALPLTLLLALVPLLAWSMPRVPWGVIAYGRFMATYGNRLAPRIIPEKEVPNAGIPDIFCTYVGEGLNGSVAVTKWTSGVRNFHSAGKVQASSEPRDMRLQRMLGHLSALAHPHPESVLVVACGAGVTAGSFVVHPTVKRIVICDIEPLVPRDIAPQFAKENYGVVSDPRTQIVLDDGRHFLRTTKEKFDIITSDPIDPWVKGCAALNTVEYYEMCKAHLKPGGVMSLWVPLYESNSETIKSLLATFFHVFPNGILWSNDTEGEGYDAVLFGQVEPTQFDVDALQERLNRADHARVKESLHEVGFNTAVSLLSTYAGQARDLAPWMRNAQLNTDRNLRLQYLAGLAFNSYQGSEILADIQRYYRFPDQLFVGANPRTKMLRFAIEGRIRN
jgi:spermidine synthase